MTRSIYCPYCHRLTSINFQAKHPSRYGLYWIGECNNPDCAKCVLVLGESTVVEMFPRPLPRPVASDIPPAVRSDFEEALKCESVGAYRAAGAMARRALQDCCLDRGAPAGSRLVEQIDWLATSGIIPSQLRDWAHEIRLTGNDCAHPSRPEDEIPVTEQDVKEILDLLEHITSTLYVAVATAGRRKKEREEREKHPTT